MPRSCDPRVWYHMTITNKKWSPAVILKLLVARASRAVLGFRIPHLFDLLKNWIMRQIYWRSFLHVPLSPGRAYMRLEILWYFSEMLISLVNQNQSKETERKLVFFQEERPNYGTRTQTTQNLNKKS